MARIKYVPNRVIDHNGISDGANVFVYQSGTTTPVQLYLDEALTEPVSNPYPVPTGAPIPVLYHNFDGNVRMRVVAADGSVPLDEDPYDTFALAYDLASPGGAEKVGVDDGASGSLWTNVAGALDYLRGEDGSNILGFRRSAADAVSRTVYAKLADLAVTPQDFGAAGDGVADDTDAIEAAIAASKFVYLPPARYRITRTIKTRTGLTFFGAGHSTVIVADNITGPAILTYPGSGNLGAPYQDISNFTVVGTATCAVAFAHCTVTTAHNIYLAVEGLDRFTGQDGFVFEHFWSSKFWMLFTNGASLSGSPFKINRVVLNSCFDLLYTSNLCDYLFDFDNTVQEYSTGPGGGNGRLSFRAITAQGADKYAIRYNYTGVSIYDMYNENNLGILNVVGGTDLTFYRSNFQGTRSGSSTHDIWIDYIAEEASSLISGITFNDCAFMHTVKKVIGSVTANVMFSNPRVTNNSQLLPLIERTAGTPSTMPVTIIEQGSNHGHIVMKTNNFSHKLADMYLTESTGAPVWAGTIVTPPLTSATKY